MKQEVYVISDDFGVCFSEFYLSSTAMLPGPAIPILSQVFSAIPEKSSKIRKRRIRIMHGIQTRFCLMEIRPQFHLLWIDVLKNILNCFGCVCPGIGN